MRLLTTLPLASLAALALFSTSAVAQSGWTEVFPTTVPTGRSGIVGCSDTTGMLVFGGKNAAYLNQLYRFDTVSGNWTNMAPSGTLPSARNNYAAAYDLARGVLVVYGGDAGGTANANISGETWEWSTATNTWSNKTPTVPVYGANTPPQLSLSRMVYDAVHGHCILFGGKGNSTTAPIETNETWTWDGTTWTKLLPANSPPARRSGMMAYDSSNGTTLAWGGVSTTGGTVYHGETWLWDGTDWTQIPTATVPFANGTYAAAQLCDLVYDGSRNRFVLTSGIYTGTLWTSTDTWEFDGVDWVNQGPSAGPNGRYSQATAYIQAAGKTIQFGGYSFPLGGVWLNRTFEYEPGAPIVNFCTAGTSTNGCVPAISATGQPSVSLASGCVLNVANVEGQKSGLIFYGIDNTGYTANPWSAGSSSFLCVKPPTQRMPAQGSGGTTGQCDGALTQDWNAYQASNPTALGNPFLVGNKVYAQAWYRDPPAPKTTNLSDGLELTCIP